jgi:hypothetical protein
LEKRIAPDSDPWEDVGREVVNVLVRENVLLVGGWAEALRQRTIRRLKIMTML